MPELPEAETIVRQIRGALAGATFGAVRHLRTDIVRAAARPLKRALSGSAILEVSRRGKRVAIELAGGLRLVIGLGMSGHVSIAASSDAIARHTHLRIAIGDGARELRFCDPRRFGGLWLLNGDAGEEHAGFARLGPEPLALGLREFRQIMSRKRQAKALLMDQSAIAGLGNIYCDESLFRAGIHPLARAAEVDPRRIQRLHQAIRRVLSNAIASEGSSVNSYRTANGRPGAFQFKLRVYDREGESCVRCRSPIRRIIAAGRSTHYCAVCQRMQNIE